MTSLTSSGRTRLLRLLTLVAIAPMAWLPAGDALAVDREKFSAEIKADSAAQIDANQAKGHFKDNGHPILQQYHARLRDYGLIDEALAVAGD